MNTIERMAGANGEGDDLIKSRASRLGIAVETIGRRPGGQLATVSGRMARRGTTTALLYIPDEIHVEIEQRCAGPKASVCLGLIEWALQELEQRELTLNVTVGIKP